MINQSENDKAFYEALKRVNRKNRIKKNNTLKEFLLKNAPKIFNKVWENLYKED